MGLEGFDVALGLAASAVEVFVKRAGIALFQVGATEVENLGRATMTVSARAKISVRGQRARIARSSRRKNALICLPLGRLVGRSMAVMKRPSPSNTTIG